MPTQTFYFMKPVLIVGLLGSVPWISAGDLNPPPGPIAPTNRAQLNAQTVSFPIVIGISGSYVLTSNLVGISGQHGIAIVTDDVTIDLNGFALLGVAGSLDGVNVGGARRNIAVLNGSIRAWGGHGVNASTVQNCRISGLLSTGNGGDGLLIGSDSLVVGLNSASNVGAGIVVAGDGNRVEGCHLVLNGTGIMVTGQNNLIVKNSALGNGIDFSIVANNAYGPIVMVGGVGNIATVTNANHPWANFSSTCVPQTQCRDADGDGFGNPGITTIACPPPPGYVSNCTDCNDAIANANPAASELCDGLDNNCNGVTDEGILCGANSTCTAGSCSCNANFADCDLVPGNGCEANLLTDVNHCGSCPVVCGLNQVCNSGVCQGSLANGTACGGGGDCQSGFCVDGFCCNSACSALCAACSAALTEVVSIPVEIA